MISKLFIHAAVWASGSGGPGFDGTELVRKHLPLGWKPAGEAHPLSQPPWRCAACSYLIEPLIIGPRAGGTRYNKEWFTAVNPTEQLDILLYAWLTEPDAQQAELRFSRYFRAAFPQLCRYIGSLRVDAAEAQDIAQRSLIKFFNHLGIQRRTAAEQVHLARSALKPLALGELHARRLERWREQVGRFRDAAISFSVSDDTLRHGTPWQEIREEINGRVEPLHQDGCAFLTEARTHIGGALARVVETSIERSSLRRQNAEDTATTGAHDAKFQPEVALRSFVTTLLQLADSQGAAHLDESVGCPGAAAFVAGTNTVCEHLPALAVPSNGLLYTIAKRLFLDDLKKWRPDSTPAVAELADPEAEEALEALDLGGEVAPQAPSPDRRQAQAKGDLFVFEECGEKLAARYQAFIEFLRAPLTRAEAALAVAATPGKARTEQERVNSLQLRYERLMAVLAALHESPQPGEEEIARRHGLTRNQVKYAIERVREEFQYFFPDLAREARGRRKRQGAEPSGT